MNIKEIFIQKFKRNKELSKSFIWRLIQLVAKQGSSALMFFIATFFLSKEDMGIYNYVFSALGLLVIFSDFGISTATSKFVAEYNVLNPEKVKKVFFNTGLIILLVSMLLSLIIILWGHILFPDYYKYIIYALPLLLFSPLTSLLDGIYRGLKRFKILSTISIIIGFIGIFLSYIFVNQFGLMGALISQSIFYGIYTFVLISLQNEKIAQLDRKIIKEVTKYSISFGIATLGFYLFSKVNILILGQYQLLEEIAVYELLNKIFTVLLIPVTVLGQVLAPTIVEMFSLGHYSKVRQLFKKLLLYLSLIALAFIPLAMIFTSWGIKILLPEYSNDILLLLLLPVTITYAKMIPGATLNYAFITSTGHASIMAVQNIISGIINVILNIFAIKYWGYLGVIWVTFVVQTISLIFLYIIYYSKLRKLKDE